MADQGEYYSYKKDLEKRLERAIKAEEEAYQNALKNPTDENINWLNNRRMDIKIIESRIENLGKEGPYMDEYYLPEI